MSRLISAQEVIDRSTRAEIWLVVDGFVYDLTDFAPTHPGGPGVIMRNAGRDATAAYSAVHPPSLIKTALDPSKALGQLDQSTVPEEWQLPASSRSATAAAAAENKNRTSSTNTDKPQPPPLTSLISTHDFESAASLIYSPKAWAFLSSAATDLHTKRRNSSAYARIVLRPRVLRDVSAPLISTRTAMLGHPIRAPIFCSPTSLGTVFHPDGEKALGRACARLGVPQCVSTSAAFPVREVVAAVREVEEEEKASGGGADAASGGGGGGGGRIQKHQKSDKIPVFFQLYVDKNRAKSSSLLHDVVAAGTSGVFLTVDAPVPGKREADERLSADEATALALTSPPPMTDVSAPPRNDSKGGALGRVMGSFIDAGVTWKDIAWLRDALHSGTPIVLKGVQTAADAMLALEAGVDGILVSNHGGRSLDTAPASVEVLLELHRCCPEVFEKMEVFVDGGVSRGTDIFKALCLGARAVGIGRGFLYGLAYGEEGVQRYIEILIDELETTMKMCGVTSLDQVHAGYLNTLALDPLIPDSADHPYVKWRPRKAQSKL